MPRIHSVPLLGVFLIAAVFGVTGCASETEMTAPPVEMSDPFSAAGDQPVPERWWREFGDARLNAIVDTATRSNFGLKAAWQRLQAAEAIVDREQGALYPDLQVDAEGRATRTRPDGPDSETLDLGASSAYEVDLWGRIDARIDAERLRARADLAAYRTAALSVSADIVRTWYRLAETRSQLRLVRSQIETNEQVLDLLETRFQTGQIERVDILRQRQLVEATREQETVLESRREVVTHQLAVLLGRPPQSDLPTPPDTLPDLPPLPDAGLPTDLVRRRPDVREAHRLLKAADRELAVAITNQYPRLTLTAGVSTVADNASSLFETWAYSFAGNLLAPLFRGGALRAEVDRAEAVKERRLYEYGQTVLTAFQEVEDALIREKKQRERIQDLQNQVNLARQSYRQLRVQYLNGAADYLDVLTALDEVQQLRRDRLAAQRTLIEDRIALYRALAGPFETARESQ